MNTPTRTRRNPGIGGRIAVLFLLAFWLTGCATYYYTPVKPPGGLLITVMKAPLTTNYNRTACGSSLTKVSSSSTHYFYEFLFTHLDFAWDEATIAEMAHKRGIKEVAYADYQVVDILGIFATFTVNIYGN